jgi:DNA-binding winged helix-turn-helix (wHTH) protein/tetratricopeptide (TPR) repeat protein
MVQAFRFGGFVLNGDAFELHRGSALVAVEPLVLDLLVLLLERPGAVLSRDALMAQIWKGRIVSDTTISTAIKSARKAVGDTGRDQKYIRTVRGRGIQWVMPLEPLESAKPVCADTESRHADAGAQPVLYVRCVDAMNDPALGPLARATSARAASILARIPLLQIASPFELADEVTDPRELHARFAIAYLLELRLQRTENTLTADATLTETRNGLQMWAQRFETVNGPGDQEILLHKMIRRIEPRLMQAMVADMQLPGGGADARGCLLKAIGLLALRGWNRATFAEATDLIERSVALAPSLALAHAYLALVKALGHRVGLLRGDDRVVPAAVAAAERALDLESQDSTVLGLVGCALADVGQVERALPILHKSIEAGPQNGHAKTALGAALMMKQDYKAAASLLAEGMACSPADSRLSVWGTALALAQLAQGELDGALESATNACQEDDRLYLPRLALAGVHLVRKEPAEMAAAVRETLRTKPDLSPPETVCVLGERLGAAIWSMVEGLPAAGQSGSRPSAAAGLPKRR